MSSPFAPPESGDDGGSSFTGYPAASLDMRIKAKLFDSLFMFIGVLPGGLLLSLTETVPLMSGLGLLLCVLGLMSVSVYNWVLLVREGRTLGKRVTRLRVVRVDGGKVDFLSGVVLRSWTVYGGLTTVAMFGMPWLLLVDWLPMIFSYDRRCLHDYLARTRVIVT